MNTCMYPKNIQNMRLKTFDISKALVEIVELQTNDD